MNCRCALQPDKWLTDTIGVKAYALHFDSGCPGEGSTGKCGALDWSHRADGEPMFVYAKVDPDAIHQIAWLENNRFCLVDTRVLLQKPVDSVSSDELGQIERSAGAEAGLPVVFRMARPAERQAVEDIARSSFSHSRFHRDPQFAREMADKVKADWAGNYFNGKRGNEMAVALVGDQIAGFLQLMVKNETLVILDLIAVGEAYRGLGLARGLVRFAETYYQKYETMLAGTQIVNSPSLQLFQRLGFKVECGQYVFHYHKGRGSIENAS